MVTGDRTHTVWTTAGQAMNRVGKQPITAPDRKDTSDVKRPVDLEAEHVHTHRHVQTRPPPPGEQSARGGGTSRPRLTSQPRNPPTSVQCQTPQKEYFVAKTPHTIPRARVHPTRPGRRGPGARARRRAAAGEPSRLLFRRTPHLDSSFLPTSAVLSSVSPSVPPESAASGAR